MAANKLVCGVQLDPMLNHCVTCAKGGGVVQRHDAVVRCLANLIQKYKNTQARVEQWVPTMQRTAQGAQARLDVVFFDNGRPAYLDVAIVPPILSRCGTHDGSGSQARLHGAQGREKQV